VGFTLPAAALKEQLARGGGPQRVLRAQLERHARLRALLGERTELDVRTCSFQCVVHERTSGPNWLLVGEAAAMVDPLTSHGFTAALRFGSHAAAMLARSLQEEELPRRERRVYDACLQRTARAFNRHIERAAYRPRFRRRLGTYQATLCYVLFGYFANALYQKLRPRGSWRSWVLHCILCGFEVWFAGWALLASCRRPRPAPAVP
jgi:2-polyprenyl-6-methoxyphenol hydroxylase-like FAD-dependent oxidoreductase